MIPREMDLNRMAYVNTRGHATSFSSQTHLMRDLAVALFEGGSGRAGLVPGGLPSEGADHEHQRLSRNLPPQKEPEIEKIKS